MSDFDKTRLYADIADRDDLIEQLQQRNDELAATVERLCFAIDLIRTLKEGIHTRTSSSFKERLEVWHQVNEITETTPQQNLNALKREVAHKAFVKGAVWADKNPVNDYSNSVSDGAIEYANTKYPTEGE